MDVTNRMQSNDSKSKPLEARGSTVAETQPWSERDRTYMQMAMDEARAAAAQGDVPVGAVLVSDADGTVLGMGHNTRECMHTALGHAELNALDAACAALGTRRLPMCTLYVTLEPCPMCAGAILQARIGRVVCGTADPVIGAMGSVWAIHRHPMYAAHTQVVYGCEESACKELLQQFFRDRRKEE